MENDAKFHWKFKQDRTCQKEIFRHVHVLLSKFYLNFILEHFWINWVIEQNLAKVVFHVYLNFIQFFLGKLDLSKFCPNSLWINLDKETWTGLSVVAPTKKQSLIEIAREEDPFLGIWMGPPEKLNMPEPTQNPRSKSFEVPSAKVTFFLIKSDIDVPKCCDDLSFNSRVILDFFLFWNCNFENCLKHLGLNYHLPTYLTLKGHYRTRAIITRSWLETALLY